jgi:hypothetical protein
MPWAYDPYWTVARTNYLGSNLQDGDTSSYTSGGGPAHMRLLKFNGNRGFQHQYGYTFSDVGQAPDKRTLPWIQSQGDYSWRSKLGALEPTKGMGRFFNVMPNGYQQTGIPRGGAVPRVTDTLGGDGNGDITDPVESVTQGALTGEKGKAVYENNRFMGIKKTPEKTTGRKVLIYETAAKNRIAKSRRK